VYPKTVVDCDVVRLYQTARRPQPAPVEPFDDATVNRIEALFARVQQDRAK
jgi:hypothetical protein